MNKHIESRADYDAVQEAVASGINVSDVEYGLRELGFMARLDTVDWRQFGTIILEGGENETACVVTLRVESVQIGYATTAVDRGSSADA
jgi:hypothetical protein